MNTTTSRIRQIAATIRARRKAVHLTATEVAALATVSRRMLIEVEGGKRPNVGISSLIRILDVLGLDLIVSSRGLPGTRDASGRRHQDV